MTSNKVHHIECKASAFQNIKVITRTKLKISQTCLNTGKKLETMKLKKKHCFYFPSKSKCTCTYVLIDI